MAGKYEKFKFDRNKFSGWIRNQTRNWTGTRLELPLGVNQVRHVYTISRVDWKKQKSLLQ